MKENGMTFTFVLSENSCHINFPFSFGVDCGSKNFPICRWFLPPIKNVFGGVCWIFALYFQQQQLEQFSFTNEREEKLWKTMDCSMNGKWLIVSSPTFKPKWKRSENLENGQKNFPFSFTTKNNNNNNNNNCFCSFFRLLLTLLLLLSYETRWRWRKCLPPALFPPLCQWFCWSNSNFPKKNRLIWWICAIFSFVSFNFIVLSNAIMIRIKIIMILRHSKRMRFSSFQFDKKN